MGSWLLALSVISLAAVTTPGERLPRIESEFLNGKPAVLPDAAAGRIALVAFGLTYDSRFAVENWVARFRKDFEKNPQVTFYEVPMIGGMSRLGKWFIDRGMRGGTPLADQSHVITVYGGVVPWKQRLGFKDPHSAYLLLLDPTGTVQWSYSGKFEESAYRALAAEVNRLSQ